MKRKRRNHSAEFKAKVALAALREDRTLAELAACLMYIRTRYRMWKKRLLENAGDIFSRSAHSGVPDAEAVAALHAMIGQLTMENDFLERGFERIHGPRGKKW